MSSKPTRIPNPWAEAGARLAGRMSRRALLSKLLPRLGLGLGVAAITVIALRMQGTRTLLGLDSRLLLAVGVLMGGLLAWRARSPSSLPDAGAAAWALDRLAGARERGLAAAVLEGPAAAEVRFAEPALAPPPRVRLAPPQGLLVLGGAGLLALLAGLVPTPEAAPRGPTGPAHRAGGGAAEDSGSASADAAGNRAAELAAATDEAREVREALGLREEGVVRPEDVAKALNEAARREAARAAAEPDSPLAAALADPDDPQASATLAAALGDANQRQAEVQAARRQAAAERLGLGRASVPPSRRDVVERYLAARSQRARGGITGD